MIKEKIIFGIDRKKISHFTSIKLYQTINNHHTFTIKVPQSVIEEPRDYTMRNAQNWLGKTVHIALENQNNFIGIITDVNFVLEEDVVGNQIVISGHSKTEMLESGSKMYSWEDATLKEIVDSVLKNSVGKYRELKNEINPEYKQIIKYQTQYNETDFQFLQRLAKQYNEWFYYNGEILIFGKPTKFDQSISLLLGADLSKFTMGLKTIPHQFSSFTYDENQDATYKSKTAQEIKPMSRLGKFAIDASAILYDTPALEHGKISTGSEGALEQLLNAKQQSAVAKSNTIKAKSSNPKLKIGSIIEVGIQKKLITNLTSNSNIPQMKINNIDTYIITQITHKANNIGEYFNSFKALPVNIAKLPEPNVNFPNAKLQEAIVVDNNDPKGTGRIRVKMEWQQGSMRTPWLRVMTPDAGSSKEVGTNRGMVFIPEVGDHVLSVLGTTTPIDQL
jgi:type VI secretion system secreted protein VgrG